MKLNSHGLLKPTLGFVLAFVERPQNWFPDSPTSIPPMAKIVERQFASSFDMAYADMLRCNRAAMQNHGKLWAMVLRSNSN